MNRQVSFVGRRWALLLICAFLPLCSYSLDRVSSGSRQESNHTKLPLHHYNFEVQAASRISHWAPPSAAVAIALQPRLWQTSWLPTSGLLTALILCVAVFRSRVRPLLVRNAELEETLGRKTLELHEAIKASELAQEALRALATKDGLTKLWNRASIFELLQREVDRSARDNFPVCVIMADLDHFKLVNDIYGPLAGDCVLQDVADRIVELARPYDWVGRYGGEQLLIVLPKCSLADGLRRAEEIRCAIASHPVIVGENGIQVTCSFGAAVSNGGATAESLIAEADVMLYQAKRSGRNRVYASARETTSLA